MVYCYFVFQKINTKIFSVSDTFQQSLTMGLCTVEQSYISETPIRLADGTSPQVGRVEINVNGSWKSFCNDSFSEATANVACRMLGFSTGYVQ